MTDVYFDYAATTPPSAAVQAAVQQALTQTWANPSSPHTLGVAAERLVTASRRRVAASIGANEADVVFTSGGTEANALAVLGGARTRLRRKPHIITTNVEHSSVANACAVLEEEGARVTRLQADGDGIVHAEQVLEALTDDTGLVTMIWVNNEIGAVLPLLDIAARVKAVDEGVLIHADGVQAFGHMQLQLERSALDMASFSGHKIRGPKGVGALWRRRGVRLQPLFGEGSQEDGLRPGTENVPGIAGFGAAAEEAVFDEARSERIATMRDALWDGIEASVARHVPVKRNGPREGAVRAPHILNVSFVGLKGEVLVHALAEAGVYAATGSACSSRRRTGSATLRALGLSDAAIEGAVRFSLGDDTTGDDIEHTVERVAAVVAQLAQFAR